MADKATPYRIGEWSLSPEFRLQLDHDGFQYIGRHQIDGKNYAIGLDNLKEDWKWVIYAFVSFADGGKYIRIGKVEETGLRSRLTPRYLNDALHLKWIYVGLRNGSHSGAIVGRTQLPFRTWPVDYSPMGTAHVDKILSAIWRAWIDFCSPPSGRGKQPAGALSS